DQSLYDPTTVRTVFLAFEDKDWEQQLADFAGTDVQLPVRVTIDGRTYEGVGARFAPRERLDPDELGYKRTLLLSFDFTDPTQRIAGQRQLILVDDHRDPTGLRTALYLDVARSQVFAPWANFVQVAINGENWGIYTNVQPFDERFTVQQFGSDAGARWIVPSAGGLTYLGDDPAPYRAIYQLQTPEDPAAWTALIRLCRTLAQTPVDQLAAALADQLEIDSTVKFLALETALINQGGYRARGGGYGLYLAPSGRFQLVPLVADTSLRLVETADFSRDSGSGQSRRGTDSVTASNGAIPESVQRELSAREAAPRKAQTDLAMLLSNSFINKADRNDDRKVTPEEWLGFAQGWFSVLDENFTGAITRDGFIAGFRLFVSPPSVLDGRTHQTFGKDDPAAVLGDELFSDIDQDHDGNVTRAEFIDAFTRWHAAWSETDAKLKTKVLTEEGVNRGLNSLLGAMVFSADQSYIPTKQGRGGAGGDMAGERGGRGGGGRRGGGGGDGASASIGIPGLNLGLGSRNGRGGSNGRSVVVLREELDVYAGLDDARRPLLSKLLAVPELRMRYFACIHDLAETWLSWEKLGAQAQADHQLITPFVKEETRRASSYARFVQEFDQDGAEVQSDSEPSLKKFLSARRTYLLDNENLGEK
ncbi:MAG TPA: CotH kinase family protein, partial [Lacunisphaera sp.]